MSGYANNWRWAAVAGLAGLLVGVVGCNRSRPETGQSQPALGTQQVRAGAGEGPGQEPARPQPLPKEVVQKWTHAGARVGWLGWQQVGNLQFKLGEGAPGDVPTFQMSRWQAGVLAELPDPGRPFGLDLSDPSVTDAGLKELAGLKSLTTLELGMTQVTNAGVKELAGLKSLTTLNLISTRVTDAGLNALRKALPRCEIRR